MRNSEILNFVESHVDLTKVSPSGGKVLDIDEKDFLKIVKRLFFRNKAFRKMVFQKITDSLQDAYWD